MGKFREILHKALHDGYDAEESMECLAVVIDEHLEHVKNVDHEMYEVVIAKVQNIFDGDHITKEMIMQAGKHGYKWDLDTTTNLAIGRGVHFDKYTKEDLCYTMNELHKTFHDVLMKYGMSKPSVYIELADAFLDDPSVPDKAVRYFRAMQE